MKSLRMKDGDIQFGEKVTGMEEFLQRWINSLKIYSNECYYNVCFASELIMFCHLNLKQNPL